MEKQNKDVVGDINALAFVKSNTPAEVQIAKDQKAAVTPHLNPKYDWYQNMTHVFVSFKVVGNDKSLAKNTKVDLQKQQITLEQGDQTIVVPLSQEIDADTSEIYPFSTKLEIKLKKIEEKQNWLCLEPGKGPSTIAAPVPVNEDEQPKKAKPYASKRDWNAIERDVGKELDAEKPEGDGALNALFKQIYERADEDTRRAMMKSYQTSGGTVLSTNWGEVASKDYEGRDRPSAPDGQMWADEAEKIKATPQNNN